MAARATVLAAAFSAASAAAICSAAAGTSGPLSGHDDGDPRWSVRPISGDGSCLFRAIVQGARLADAGTALTPDAEERGARSLREQVVQALRDHREDIEPFLPGIVAPGPGGFERYLAHMAKPSTWGGEPELAMASQHVLRRPLAVYSARLADKLARAAGAGSGRSSGPGPIGDDSDAAGLPAPVVTYGEQFLDDPSAPHVVRLLWSGHHYEPLVDEHRARRLLLRGEDGGDGSGSSSSSGSGARPRTQSKL
jgi:OTU domain-containing protein 6